LRHLSSKLSHISSDPGLDFGIYV